MNLIYKLDNNANVQFPLEEPIREWSLFWHIFCHDASLCLARYRAARMRIRLNAMQAVVKLTESHSSAMRPCPFQDAIEMNNAKLVIE